MSNIEKSEQTDLFLDFKKLTGHLSLIDYPKLKELNLYSNQLETIDLSNNPMLENLLFEKNQLKTMDLSNNQKIHQLCCSSNQLKELDISSLINLNSIRIDDHTKIIGLPDWLKIYEERISSYARVSS